MRPLLLRIFLLLSATNLSSQVDLQLNTFEQIGSREATLSGASVAGASLEYLANPSGNNDIGMVSVIDDKGLQSFTTVGDALIYAFTLNILQATENNVTPLYGVGFDFGGTAALRYETSTGTQPNIRFGFNTDGNPFASGTVTDNDAGWSPYDFRALRFDEGNQIEATVALKLVAVNGLGYDYELTVRYTDGTISNSRSHTFTSVNGNQVISLFHATNSAGMVDGDAYVISNASLRFEKSSALDQASALVESLPETTLAEKAKKAVLQIGIERAQNALIAGLKQESEAIRAEVEQSLMESASTFLAVATNASQTLPIRRALVTPYATNPYLQRLATETMAQLESPDIPWPRATSVNGVINSLDGDYGARSAFKLMAEYVWLFAHEESPMKHNPEVLKRILRRAHAYIDSLELGPDVSTLPTPNWYDQFSIPVAFTSLYELRSLYPGLLLPEQRNRWDQVMLTLVTDMHTLRDDNGKWEFLKYGTSPWNINIETGRLIGVVVASQWTASQRDNTELLDRCLNRIDNTINRILPDGAIPYHGTGQASTNYHNELLLQWLLLYELLDYTPLLDAMEDTQWKGPVMGRTEEFWTSPFYKTYRWNYEKGTEAGSELVATVSRNPYVRGLLDRDMFPDYFTPGNVTPYRYQAPWYDASVIAHPLPDNYTIADRNTGGPRAWYGNFTYAGAFDPNPNRIHYEGHETFMGAMTVDSDDGRVNSILVDVTPRIWQTAEATSELSAWADLSFNEIPATTVSYHYSVSTVIHDITRRRNISQRTDAVSGWTGRQVWVGLPDRLIGLVSIVPTSGSANAYAVNGVLRLISGGTAGAVTSKLLEEITPGTHYRYGELDIIVHDTTYNSISDLILDYRVPQFRATELIFSNRSSEPLPSATLATGFSSDTEYRFVVEVRPVATTTDLTTVSVLGDRELIGLEIQGSGNSFQVWLNASDTNRTVVLERQNLPIGRDSLVLSNGILGRLPFNDSVPSSLSLQSGQHAVLVVSSNSDDHSHGWESFEDLVNTPLLSIGPVSEGLKLNYRGILQESTDLDTWKDMHPQPGSPWIFIPEAGQKHFFKIKP
jgi:hypothetical protein